jgi:Taurine catabolism dioxygenase TauD, TfdA family
VRNVGVDYRSSSGRGYSSNAELDFHIDGVDIVALSCFNKAVSGGMSMVSSSLRAHNIALQERPDLAEVLYQPFYFSRQAEEAPDEAAFYTNPVFDFHDGKFFGKWNRNRILSAQSLEGVPKLSAAQVDAMTFMDEILRRPDVMFTMYLEPGDIQILSSFNTLHSRTEFVDHEDPKQKRLLYRLWLTPPDAPALPQSWKPLFRSVSERTVRGGIIGHNYNDACRDFDRRQAAEHAMLLES